MNAQDAAELIKAIGADRQSTIRECVTWLAQNHSVYKPEFLAGHMANDLLSK